MSPKQVWAGLLVALVIIVASNSLFVVKETERGVLLKFGEVVNPDLKPGLHVKIPFVNNHRILMDVFSRLIQRQSDFSPKRKKR